jgi:hypothetical protein
MTTTGRQAGPSHLAKTFIADSDLSAAASRYTFVKVSGVQKADVCGAGEQAIGVLQVGGADNKASTVALVGGGGGTKLKVGAAVTAAAPLKSDSTGRAVTASAGEPYHAIALETVSNANEVIEALLQSGVV